MPYIQLEGQHYPLIAGENPVGGNAGARIRLTGNGGEGIQASVDVGADGAAVVRRLDGTVKVNGVALGAEPAPLLHGDRIDVAGRELFFGDDRRAGNTQFVQPVRLAESAPTAAADRRTASTGGRIISLVDGREYPVPDAGLVFGRDPTCDVVVGSTEVSRKHASLSPSSEGYLLRDTSTNGVLVNGKPASSPALLGRGDVLTIGDEEFRFYADKAPPPRAPLATLEVISSGMLKGTILDVRSPLAHVGRGAHNDLVVSDDSIRTRTRSCSVARTGGTWWTWDRRTVRTSVDGALKGRQLWWELRTCALVVSSSFFACPKMRKRETRARRARSRR